MNKRKAKRAAIIKKAILIAEDLFPEPKSGKAKKDWVVTFLNKHIDIPLIGEKAEEKLIGFTIDVVCDLLFKQGAK